MIHNAYKLPWPESIFTEMGLVFFFDDGTYKPLTEVQMVALEKAIDSLDDRTKTMIIFCYMDHKSFSEISDQFSVGAERTRQIIGKGVRLLRKTLQKSIKCF